MIEIRLGDRYAKSILELAEERKEVEDVRADFELIRSVCQSSPDFLNMLRSPIVPSGKKEAILEEIFGEKFSLITKNLVQIIIRKKREKYLNDIAVRFLHLYDLGHNITRGVLTSAKPLDAQSRKAIQDLVAKEMNTQFELEEKVDPELIGGFTLKVGDRLFDGSIATRLRDLKQEFLNNPYVKKV